MKRGSIVLCRQKGHYTSKPRPAVVIQSDEVSDKFESLTLCPITSFETQNSDSFRISLKPGKLNQLKKLSFVMVDKISTYPKECIQTTTGKLSPAIMQKVDLALRSWLQLT